MELKRVVVTGLGEITPIGHGVEATWQAMLKGKSGAAPITRFDATTYKTQFACEVKDFDPTTIIDKKDARREDEFVHFALYAADEAMRDAAFDMDNEDKDRMGVIWGSGMGGLRSFQNAAFDAATAGEEPIRLSPFTIISLICDIAAGHISLRYGLCGPNYATASACSSSSHAIADAFNQIRLGKANVILAGGSEAAVAKMGVSGFNAMHALSTRNDDYEHASRPFTGSRDGFVIGEGAGCLVLEELEHAKARGAKIYAELVGEGMTADAYHITAPDPDGRGAEKVMRLALEDAAVKTSEVDYINAHGTSTPLGDIAELNAIQRLFGEDAYKLNISSTKSMTGHLLGGAGAIEAIVAIKAIENNIVPPTINHTEGDEDERIDYRLNFTFNQPQKRKVNVAISNTFGFGGHNACLVFKRYND